MTVTFKQTEATAAATNERNLGQAIVRGAALKCPRCGEGKVFEAYLKVADECDHCAQDFSHNRADDAPPYITIVIVGHVLIGLMLHLEMTWHVHPMVYLYTMIPLSVILPIIMLPSIKGAIVGLQWALKMHGFGDATTDDPLDNPQDFGV